MRGDIVRVNRGDVRYWSGRGDGSFGTHKLPCRAGRFISGYSFSMKDSPWHCDPDGMGIQFEDVNGNGLADMVQTRYDEIDVWLNINGAAWKPRVIIGKTPVNPGNVSRVRIADINGSGTPDIIWGNGYKNQYIDLLGGKRPWLLTRVENGLGKTTDIEYTSTPSRKS